MAGRSFYNNFICNFDMPYLWFIRAGKPSFWTIITFGNWNFKWNNKKATLYYINHLMSNKTKSDRISTCVNWHELQIWFMVQLRDPPSITLVCDLIIKRKLTTGWAGFNARKKTVKNLHHISPVKSKMARCFCFIQ